MGQKITREISKDFQTKESKYVPQHHSTDVVEAIQYQLASYHRDKILHTHSLQGERFNSAFGGFSL